MLPPFQTIHYLSLQAHRGENKNYYQKDILGSVNCISLVVYEWSIPIYGIVIFAVSLQQETKVQKW
jgi:hypothetical protein